MTTLEVEWDAVLSRLWLLARGRPPGVRPLLQSTIIKKAANQLHLLFIWWSQGDYARNSRSILYGMSHS